MLKTIEHSWDKKNSRIWLTVKKGKAPLCSFPALKWSKHAAIVLESKLSTSQIVGVMIHPALSMDF